MKKVILLLVVSFLFVGCDIYHNNLQAVKDGPEYDASFGNAGYARVIEFKELDSTGLTWVVLTTIAYNNPVGVFSGPDHNLEIGSIVRIERLKFRDAGGGAKHVYVIVHSR